jgi:hypothetical protein
MNWAGFSSVFLLATIKFMFAPFGGVPFDLSFLETFLASFLGGSISSFIFYFSANYFLKKTKIKEGAKIHTKTNKLIVKLKRNTGKIGVCFWAPFFLSIPLGSIITAKFYGKYQSTFFLILLGMALNATVMTTLAYVVFG